MTVRAPMAFRGDVPDYYGLLEVKYTASSKEIRKAYRKKALVLHPDKNPDNPNAADLFDQVNKAYELLSDEKKKKEYDTKLQVQREREAKWEAANAEIRAMRETLERNERKADEKRAAKRRRTQEDQTMKRNRDIIKDIMEKMAEEDAAKTALRQGTRQKTPVTTRSETVLKAKWKKGDSHTRESLMSLLGKYGEINEISITKKKSALVFFRRKQDAEECFLQETTKNPALKLRLIRSDHDVSSAKDATFPKEAVSHASNPYASFANPMQTTGNPYSNLGNLSGNGENGLKSTSNQKSRDSSLDNYESQTLEKLRKLAAQS